MNEISEKILKCGLSSNFLPAILREYKSGWIIEYYVEHPATHNLEREKIRLTKLVSRYKLIKDARIHANKIIISLNIKLATG